MSALGNLFSDIAEAIRSKNGEEGVTYKPAQFPEKILGITVGSGSDKAITQIRGNFRGNGGTVIVEHEMNVVPDLLVVYASHIMTPPTIAVSFGFRQALLDAMGEGATAPTGFYNEHGVVTVVNTMGMEMAGSEYAAMYGAVRNATATSFAFGSDTYPSADGMAYAYIALAGLI